MSFTRKKRSIVFPNFGFQRQLMDFEKTLRNRNPDHFKVGGVKKTRPMTTGSAIRPHMPGEDSDQKGQQVKKLYTKSGKPPTGATVIEDRIKSLKSMSRIIQQVQVQANSMRPQSQQRLDLRPQTSAINNLKAQLMLEPSSPSKTIEVSKLRPKSTLARVVNPRSAEVNLK